MNEPIVHKLIQEDQSENNAKKLIITIYAVLLNITNALTIEFNVYKQ